MMMRRVCRPARPCRRPSTAPHRTALQSRMARGLAAPLLYVVGLTTAIATYHTLAEVCGVCVWGGWGGGRWGPAPACGERGLGGN